MDVCDAWGWEGLTVSCKRNNSIVKAIDMIKSFYIIICKSN